MDHSNDDDDVPATQEEMDEMLRELEDPAYEQLITEEEFFAALYEAIKVHNAQCVEGHC